MRLDKITSDYNRTLVIIDLVNHVTDYLRYMWKKTYKEKLWFITQ